MSAPTALESGALVRGIAWFNRPTPKTQALTPGTADRRSEAPVALLTRQHDDLCVQASDPLEIAAVLESSGLTDTRARSAYRAAGVFDVAEQMWQDVPWRSQPERERPDLWHLPLWRSQLRGALYAVPAVVASLIPAQLSGGLDYAVLAVATALAIAATQAISVLGHVLLDRGQSRAVAQLTTTALALAVVVAGAATAACLVVGRPAMLALAPGGQLVFVVGATVLMLGGHDRLLLALLAPGAFLALLAVAGLPGGTTAQGLQVAAVLAIVVTAAGAWVRMGRAGDGDSLRRALGRVELSHAGTAALYGLGLSALVTYAVVGVASGHVATSGGWLLVATVPLTATVGGSEYLLHRARSRCTTALPAAADVAAFRARASSHLRAMVAVHAATVGLVAALVLAALWLGHADPVLAVYAGGYAVLGVALLLTTTLVSIGFSGLAAALVCTGGALLLLVDLVPGVHGQGLVITQLALVAGLAATAYRFTAARFTTVAVHR